MVPCGLGLGLGLGLLLLLLWLLFFFFFFLFFFSVFFLCSCSCPRSCSCWWRKPYISFARCSCSWRQWQIISQRFMMICVPPRSHPCILQYRTMKPDGTHDWFFKRTVFIRWTLSMAISWIDVGFNSDLSEMFSACLLLAPIPISLKDALPSRSEFWCQISKWYNHNEQMTCPSSWLHSSGGVLYICGIILRSTVSNEARQMATRQGPEITISSWYFHSVELPSWR